MPYRVAVHDWDADGSDGALATLRIYVDGVLAYEAQGVPLRAQDLWDAATVTWPSGAVEPVVGPGGGPQIFPGCVGFQPT